MDSHPRLQHEPAGTATGKPTAHTLGLSFEPLVLRQDPDGDTHTHNTDAVSSKEAKSVVTSLSRDP